MKLGRGLNTADAQYSLNMDDGFAIDVEEKQTQTNFGSIILNEEIVEAIGKRTDDLFHVLNKRLDRFERRLEERDKEIDVLKGILSGLKRSFACVYGKTD